MAKPYEAGNAAWEAAGVKLWSGPKLSKGQAARIVRQLHAECLRQYNLSPTDRWWLERAADPKRKVYVRPVWLSQGVTRLVHDVSHNIAGRLWQHLRPHSREHEIMERRLIAFAIARGYHKLVRPGPKPKAPKAPVVERRAAAAQANLKRAQTRLKRAQTLVKKWQAKVKHYAKPKAAPRVRTQTCTNCADGTCDWCQAGNPLGH